jgi:hypothetical protein
MRNSAKPIRKGSRTAPEIRERIRELWAQDYNSRQIADQLAEEFAVAPNERTVRNYVRRLSLEREANRAATDDELWSFWADSMTPEDARLVLALPARLRERLPEGFARRYVRARRAFPELSDLAAWGFALRAGSTGRQEAADEMLRHVAAITGREVEQ